MTKEELQIKYDAVIKMCKQSDLQIELLQEIIKIANSYNSVLMKCAIDSVKKNGKYPQEMFLYVIEN